MAELRQRLAATSEKRGAASASSSGQGVIPNCEVLLVTPLPHSPGREEREPDERPSEHHPHETGCNIIDPATNQAVEKSRIYEPTPLEHFANTVTHAIPILPCTFLGKVLLDDTPESYQIPFMISYGFFTVLLFVASTAYHSCEMVYRPGHKKLRFYMHKCDRVVIYLYIAASSAPWLITRGVEVAGVNLLWYVWLAALCGIVFQWNFHERYETLDTLFYMLVATIPYVGILLMRDLSGVPVMLASAGVYVLGVFFFKMDGVIPFAHAIWHIHVVLAVALNIYTVHRNLLGAGF